MNQNLIDISRLLRIRKRMIARWRLVALLALLVVVGVTYALTLPAVTLENSLICGKQEHIHTADCYAQVEGEEPVLVCGCEEHIHDASCLETALPEPQAPPQTQEYLCGFTYEHQHSADCYVDGVLVCTLTEHTHTEACLTAQASVPTAPQPSVPTAPQPENPADEPTGDLLPADAPGAAPTPDEPQENAPEDEPVDAPLQLQGGFVDVAALISQPGYVDIRTIPTASVSFSLQVDGRDVAIEHFRGNGIFSLGMTGLDLDGYDDYIYYYKLDKAGFTLYAGAQKLEDFTQASPGVSTQINYWAVKDAADYYYLLFQPMRNSGIVTGFSMTGNAVSAKDPGIASVSKMVSWSSRDLAFQYTTTVTLPPMANFYDQSYTLYDTTEIPAVPITYSPFQPGAPMSLRYSVAGSAERTLYPIEDVKDNPAETLAYYLDSNGITFLNRTTHAGACQTARSQALSGAFPGWCACWEQTQQVTVTVSYVDAKAQQYFGENPRARINNSAILEKADTTRITTNANVSIPAILDKGFDLMSKKCTINVNSDFYDLSQCANISIVDTMINAVYDGGFSVTRKDVLGNTTLMTEGADYTFSLSADQTQFSVRLLHPDSSEYIITYNVDKRGSGTASNNVCIGSSQIAQNVVMDFNYSVSTTSYDCEVSFLKQYEDGNPVTGAEFGLYKPDGTLLARSAVTAAGERVITKISGTGVVSSWGNVLYPLTGDDRVTFDSRAGLRSGQLFYIQELTAPQNHMLDETKYYFFISSQPNATSPVTPITQVNGQTVNVLTSWTLRPDPSNMTSYYYYLDYEYTVPLMNYKAYLLPETGGMGVLPIWLCGACLMLPWLLYRRRKRNQRNSSTA